MTDIIGEAVAGWTHGLSKAQAIREIYRRIRDIPYAVVPELVHPADYVRILDIGKGSCSPKHLLLAEMYRRLGIDALLAVYPFRWDPEVVVFPPDLRRMARSMGQGYHLACKVVVDGRLVLVDATLDPPLRKLGFTVNSDWDGKSDTILPVVPCGEEVVYHPSEAALMPLPTVDTASAAFYHKLNLWLETARTGTGLPEATPP